MPESLLTQRSLVWPPFTWTTTLLKRSRLCFMHVAMPRSRRGNLVYTRLQMHFTS